MKKKEIILFNTSLFRRAFCVKNTTNPHIAEATDTLPNCELRDHSLVQRTWKSNNDPVIGFQSELCYLNRFP